jgi:hypothetical protein
MLEARSNAEDALKSVITAWEKRLNSDNENMDGSTNEPYRNNKYNKPESDFEPDDKPGGYNEDDMLGSELS